MKTIQIITVVDRVTIFFWNFLNLAMSGNTANIMENLGKRHRVGEISEAICILGDI